MRRILNAFFSPLGGSVYFQRAGGGGGLGRAKEPNTWSQKKRRQNLQSVRRPVVPTFQNQEQNQKKTSQTRDRDGFLPNSAVDGGKDDCEYAALLLRGRQNGQLGAALLIGSRLERDGTCRTRAVISSWPIPGSHPKP